LAIKTIIYIEFLDHSSGSNGWLSKDEFKEECKIETCCVVGFVEWEDDKAFYLSTMKGTTELGSGHIILKSCITKQKYLQKPVLKTIQRLNS